MRVRCSNKCFNKHSVAIGWGDRLLIRERMAFLQKKLYPGLHSLGGGEGALKLK